MDVSGLLSEIDAQINALQTARAAIAGLGTTTPVRRGPGRPKAVTTLPKAIPKKRQMTAKGRAAIAAAQKARWAAQKKAAKKS
jgi:hypothetical protein